MPSAAQVRQREIRVFISSTFRDMQEEREELVKRIFPQLRRLCESRGVTWGEVDLRWGIPDEAKAEGKVLPICLEEIHRCRPYFIGLLGERYGWVPDEIAPALLAQEPWLAELRGHSVTELEILHGVLNNPQMAEHAFFYFRDPAYVQSVPEEHREDFCSAKPEDTEKLRKLKERIRKSGFPVREGYRNPKVLGRAVRRDLTRVVNKLFPQGSQPDPLDREAAEHEAFARSRAAVEVSAERSVGVYIGRQAYFDRLDAHAASDGPPLVVLGESGSGKSALLANWALRYRVSHPAELLIMHFIGATPASADWAALVRRILGEFNRRFDLKIETPDKPDALRMTFANALYMAATKGRVILILDALNQLEDRDQAPDLVWLPPVLPAEVRLIVSTLPGRALDDLRKRGWLTLQVEPLNPEERKKLIIDYLAQYAHALSPARVERIAGAPQSANPLYLRALLEELRLWGEHETLPSRIEHYLSATTVPTLYQKILERYEQDYERDRPGLVRDAMTLLWAARRGLSEAELMDLLGSNGQPLPRAYWSPLYLTAEQSLVSCSGLIGFFHDYFREAVRKRYLPTDEDCRRAHLRLADYFDALELDSRQVDELPWQLAEAQAWSQLYDLLGEAAFFDAAWEASELEVRAYWARVEASSSLKIVDAYRQLVESPQYFEDQIQHPWNVARLLRGTGHFREAVPLLEHLANHLRQTGDMSQLSSVLETLGTILHAQGELERALVILKEAEILSRARHDSWGTASILSNAALILMDGGHWDMAMDALTRCESFYRTLGDKAALQNILYFRAFILLDQGEVKAAEELYSEQERICRETGLKDGLQSCLGMRAMLLDQCGQAEQAEVLLKEKEQICRELGDRDGLSVALGNRAVLLRKHGKLDAAMILHRQEEELCREVGNKKGLAACLGNQTRIWLERHDCPAAMALIQQQEGLCREMQGKTSLVECLTLKVYALGQSSQFNAVPPVLQELDRLAREIGARTDARPQARFVPAMTKGLLEIFDGIRDGTILDQQRPGLHDPETDPDYWERRGLATTTIGSYEEAANYFDRGLALDPDSLSLLHNKGTALMQAGRLDAALACFDRCLELAPEHANAWDKKGVALMQAGRLDAALACFGRCLELSPDHANAWNNKGVAMLMGGRHDEALAAFNRALEFDPSCATAQEGRKRALSALAQSAQTTATNDRIRAMRQKEIPGVDMKPESGYVPCPCCGFQLSTENEALRRARKLGAGLARIQCPGCGVILVFDLEANKVEAEAEFKRRLGAA